MKTGRNMNKWTGPKKQHISDLSNHMNSRKSYITKQIWMCKCVCVCVFDTVGGGEFFIIKGDIFKQL